MTSTTTSRFLLCWTIAALAAGCCEATTTIYQTNYVARYTFLLDFLCTAPLPELLLECPSTHATIVLEGIQRDPDMECTSLAKNVMSCKASSCDEDADQCSVLVDGGLGAEEAYGHVYFRCDAASSVEDTKARFTYLGITEDEPAECDPNLTSFLWLASANRVFHIHQLGVYCPDQGVEGEFVFDAQFVECPNQSGRILGELGYICGAGEDCEYAACTVDSLDDSIMVSQMETVQEASCFTTRTATTEEEAELVAAAIPPTAAPTYQYPMGSGTFATKYKAQWRTRELDGFCTTASPVVRIRCLGDSQLVLLDTLHDETNCTMMSDQEMECRETCEQDDGDDCGYYKFPRFQTPDWGSPFEGAGAIYECVNAIQPPYSEVEYLSETTTCCGEDNWCYSSSSADIDYADHAVNLGMFCGSKTGGGDYFSDDNINDCSPYSKAGQIDMYIKEGVGPVGTAEVVCSAKIPEPITIPAASGPFEFDVPSVKIYSQRHFRDDCYRFTQDPEVVEDLEDAEVLEDSNSTSTMVNASSNNSTDDDAENAAAASVARNPDLGF